MDNILEVKNLKISFRTMNGTVKAVRNIDFDLHRGETLAIVGESGSGKSVTSKAVLGILAGNSIVESGEILYDGRDLLKISEEEMCKIRGDKISMIFQDPLSALDPIVKIGKQITEAMLLKNKTNRKRARREFNTLLAALKDTMLEICVPQGMATAEEINTMAETFDKFNILAIKLENSYNIARTHAGELRVDIKDFLFKAEKKQKLDVKRSLASFEKLLRLTKDDFFSVNEYDNIEKYAAALANERAAYDPKADMGTDAYTTLTDSLVELLSNIDVLLESLEQRTTPNFFRIGYYMLMNPEAAVTGADIDALNELALKFLDDNFMKRFIELESIAILYSHKNALSKKAKALEVLRLERKYFESSDFIPADTKLHIKVATAAVEDAIDKLEFIKDSVAYTFGSSLSSVANKYFVYKKLNPKEEARFARRTAKREALVARGKKVDWKVLPKNVYDLELLRREMLSLIDRVSAKYEADIAADGSFDVSSRAIGLIDYLKERASEVVYKVTKRMARDKAIKLMEEVGIPEPQKRYYQYPFEFSGGMRQRIVIAIALAANPDILICDEPTTALDVTIQAQILELINNLKRERKLSIIFITHDLGVVANMADRIAVMYAGKIVEYGTSEDVFYNPRHPYTWALLSSMPDLDTNEKLDAIPGTPPNMIYPPVGDAFAARNKYAMQIDFEEQPPMFKVSDTHYAATWLLHPDAPEVEIPKVITDRISRMTGKRGDASNG